MKQYRKIMMVAGIRIAVESDRPFCFSPRCAFFEVTGKISDVTFEINWDFQPPEDAEIIFDSEKYQLRKKKDRVYRLCHRDYHQEGYDWYCCKVDHCPVRYEVGICGNGEAQEQINPFHYVDLSEFMIQFDAAVLHSSLIRFYDRAIVFSAPSQTGKSTQAEIWEKYYGAEIINGDRSVIRCTDQGWIAGGSPYAGSSRIYKKEYAQIEAIVVLRQAKENTIRRLNIKEAYLCILSELAISPTDKKSVDEVSLWLLNLLNHVPVYMLCCLPDRSAADLLYHTLEDYGNGK